MSYNVAFGIDIDKTSRLSLAGSSLGPMMMYLSIIGRFKLSYTSTNINRIVMGTNLTVARGL